MFGGDKFATAIELEDEVTQLAQVLDFDEVSDSDIDRGLVLIEKVHTYLERLNSNRSRHSIVVLGTTGVGKSTVVSLLFGDGKVVVHHENEFSRVLEAENPIPGVDIQSGASSKTLIPGVLRTTMNDTPVVVFDMSGSQDTRGPFAELVVHSILKWSLAKHEHMRFLLVATPPQDRPQYAALADMINRFSGSGSNAVLVYTKCDREFDPKSTRVLEGIYRDRCGIPAFALPKPAKSDGEGADYSAECKDTLRDIRNEVVLAETPADVTVGSIPESAQLLLHQFCNRSITKAREVLSKEFLRVYSYDNYRRSMEEIAVVLEALASQQPIDFESLIQLLQRMFPRVCRIRHLSSVLKAIERLKHGSEESVYTYRQVHKKKATHTLVMSAWHLCLSTEDAADIKDFVDMVHTTTSNELPTVVLIGFPKVTLNVPLRVWANVIIVSPLVRMCMMDLSAEGEAPAPVPSRAAPGEDGVHGAPGRYGGNFGGVGQNGGRGLDGEDSNYETSEFKASAVQLIKQLTTLQKWKCAFKSLPSGFKLENSSAVEVLPANRDIKRAVVRSAVVTAAMGVSAVVPEMGLAVGAVAMAIGGAMIGKSFERITKTELELSRARV